jgi:membrane-associated protease RseP (regulator of RpoE activity)
MSALTGMILGMVAVVVAFGFIIFIHEMGHFLTARAVDIRCPQFAIGFGPRLFGFRWRGTNFAVRLFPLGGYVLMNGEEPTAREEDPWSQAVSHYLGEEAFPATPQRLLQRLATVPEAERNQAWQEVHDQVAFARAKEFPDLRSVEGNFHDRSIPARILVISGGVIMNFLATILILWGLAPVVGVGSFFRDWAPVISQVEAGWPADLAGVKSGDRILSVNGRTTSTFSEAFEAIGAHPCQPTEITLLHEGQEVTRTIVPLLAIGNDRFRLNEQGQLQLVDSAQHKELIGRVVASPGLEALLEAVRTPGVKSYQLTLEGESQPVLFELAEGYTAPRGQVGVLFGVSDIRFEKELTVTVQAVTPGSPAEQAGVQVGDNLAFLGPYGLIPIRMTLQEGLPGFGSLAEQALQAHARLSDPTAIPLAVFQGEQLRELTVTSPRPLTSLQELGLTLTPQTTADRLASPFRMIGAMLKSPYDILSMWLSEQATGKEIVESMQGPVGIMTLIYQLSDNGLLQFLFFIALLNAAIGAFNLLPFPALDGARLVFLVIAGLRGGRQVDPEKEARVHLLGLMVLLCFVVVVTFGDIKRLIASHVFVM